MKKQIISEEFKRMQKLAGLINENMKVDAGIDKFKVNVTKVVDDDYQVVVGNREVYIKGDVNIQVDGNYTLNVTGDIIINGKTINMNHGTMGAARIGDTADTGDGGTGGHRRLKISRRKLCGFESRSGHHLHASRA